MTRTSLAVLALSLSVINVPGGAAKTLVQQAQGQPAAGEAPELLEARQLSQQVVALVSEKKYDEALPLARRALEIREKTLGREHASVGDALENLAYLYQEKGNYVVAESLYKRRLAISEKAFGPDSIRLTNTLGLLGWLSYAMGSYQRAEELFERALLITQKEFGPAHAETARSLLQLGQFHERAAHYEKAFAFYRRALDIKQQELGSEHPEVRALLSKCACALRLNGKAQEAEEYERPSRASLETNSEAAARASGRVLQGSAVRRVQPQYPRAAQQAGLSGSVIVQVTVDETGKVITARGLCGPGLLIEAAVAAAREWRFKPTLVDGAPAKVIGILTFNFYL